MTGAGGAAAAQGPAALLLGGHALVVAALLLGNEAYRDQAVIVLIAAFVAWAAALVGAARGASGLGVRFEGWVWAAALASGLLAFARPPVEAVGSVPLGPFHALSAAVLVLLVSYAVDVFGLAPVPRAFATLRRSLLFLAALAIGAWTLHVAPDPPIDLFPQHQQAAEALLHGRSIYQPGNIETWTTYRFQHAKIDEYVYLPLGACWTTLAYAITHDIRWADLAGILGGGALLWLAGRNALAGDGRPGRAEVWGDLVAALFLFHPRGWLVLEMAWTEPLSAPFLAGFVVTALARRRVAASVCLGLFVAGKQHFALYVPFLAMAPGVGLSGAALAGAVALATIVPFVLWTPYGFLRGVWLLHKGGPFRVDAMAIPAAIASRWMLPAWVGFAASVLPMGAIPRLPRRIAPLLLGACASFMLFYLLGRQAFLNYYWLLDFTALLALATLPERPGPEPAAASSA